MSAWITDGRKALLLVIGLSVFLFFFRLGDRPFRNPDEGRYAHIAGRMVDSAKWMEPQIFGIDYLRKPPLFYWLVAASFQLLGQGEWQARAVPALFGLFGVLAAYFFSRRFFGARAALFSALLLLANPWYLHVSRFLVIDAVFSFLIVASFYLFFLGLSSLRHKNKYYAAFYLSVSLAFLAKGVLALAIPGLAIFVFIVSDRRYWKIFKEMNLLMGAVIFSVIVCPWFVWISSHKPEFWNVFFFREHLSRFTSDNFEHQQGWYFYPVLLFVFFLPWSVVPGPMRICARQVSERQENGPARFLFAAIAVTLIFLSLSKSKLATYIVPVIPPACILLGSAWAQWTENRKFRQKLFVFSAGILMISLLPLVFIMERVNHDFTSKHFALKLKPQLSPADKVYVYDHPGPFYDFSFYLRHPVKPVGLYGELEISQEDESAKRISLAKADFEALIGSKEHFYCLMRLSDWNDLPEASRSFFKVLMRDERKVLFESGLRLLNTSPWETTE